MSLTLFQVAQEFRAIADQLADTDLDEQTIRDTLEGEAYPVEQKGRAVIAVFRNMGAEADAVENAAKELQARAKALRNRQESLKGYLQMAMTVTGISEIKAIDGTFKAKLYPGRDASVDVFQPELLPADYLREIPARYEPDKTLIKQAIEDGYDVPGARVVKRDRLTIS